MSIVGVLGDGAWGTAIATVLAHKGHTVKLWCSTEEVASIIHKERINTRYLPTIILDNRIEPVTDLAYFFNSVETVFEAVPVQYLRQVLTSCVLLVNSRVPWVIMSKGIESESLLLPSELVHTILGVPVVVLSGPSFAHDLAHKKLTACVLAGEYLLTKDIQSSITTNYFVTELSSDLLGVQVAGALKNCTALGIGILDSLSASDNTKALFLTRCWQEISRLILARGGFTETVLGLAGIGDFFLTCLGAQSRNVKLGKYVGKGLRLEKALEELGHVPEGLNTLKSIPKLAAHYSISLPIHQKLYDLIFGQEHPLSLLNLLTF